MKPLLAHIYEPHRVTFPCYVQPKLNGIRALYQNGHFQSRDGIPFTKGLLDHLAKPLLEVFPPDVILDGELYVHGWPLQRINAAVTPVRQQPTEDTGKVQYKVFDRIDFTQNFRQRFAEWQPMTIGLIDYVDTWYAHDQTKADELYTKFVSDGYEGMMYRLGDCPYTVPKQVNGHALLATARLKYMSDQYNRVWHMLKRKNWLDNEFRCVAFNITTGEKGERGFQLWCETANGKRFAVSSGLTDQEVEACLSNPPIGRMIKVKYLVLSVEGIPLNATILTIL